MDPVSLALGVAPLCLGALKGARHATNKIKLLKHHDQEVSRFRKRLSTQVSIFQDESQLLLQDAGVDQDLAAAMIEDYCHDYWFGADLESKIQSYLGRKYLEVKKTAEQIRDQIAKFDEELSNLEVPDEMPGCGKLATKAYRARSAFGLASQKSDLEEGIKSLTDLVNWFGRLRETAKKLGQPTAAYSKQKKAMPRSYALIATHSASFLESLSRTWSCLNSNGTHSTHTARLFLDTNASDSCVNFRIILEYEAVCGSLREQSLLFLRIRSEELSWVDTGLSPPEISPARSSAETLQPRTKIRKVRFTESPAQSSTRAASCNDECQRLREGLVYNLCQERDVCRHIFEYGKKIHQSRKEGCIGYLVSSSNLTHQFLATQDKESTAIQTRPCSSVSLASIVEPAKESDISIIDQLQLALRLARSVLRYHSTPWWRRNWSLSDLSYFDIDTELSVSLSTLHIDTKLSSKANNNMTMQSILAYVPTPQSDDDADMLCGIRNATLYSLGVALLQIGRWGALDTEDIVSVRKAAAKPTRLGPRYDSLTNRCLWCDFGFGADLNKPQLQGAIYEAVVYELEQMVCLLEGSQGGSEPR